MEQNLLASCASDRSVILYDCRESGPLRKVVMELRSNALSWNPMEAFIFTVANEDYKYVLFNHLIYNIFMLCCLLPNCSEKGCTNFYEIMCASRIGMTIGQHLFFRPLNDKGNSTTSVTVFSTSNRNLTKMQFTSFNPSSIYSFTHL